MRGRLSLFGDGGGGTGGGGNGGSKGGRGGASGRASANGRGGSLGGGRGVGKTVLFDFPPTLHERLERIVIANIVVEAAAGKRARDMKDDNNCSEC